MKICVAFASLVLAVLAFTGAPVLADGVSKEGKDLSNNIEYRSVPLALAHNDPDLTAMFNRLNTLGIAISHGNFMEINSMILSISTEAEGPRQPGPPHVEIRMDLKANALTAIYITDQKTNVYFHLNFRADGTPVAYTEHLGDGRVMRRLEIRANATPKLLTTYNTEHGQLQSQGRRVMWTENGQIESDEMIP